MKKNQLKRLFVASIALPLLALTVYPAISQAANPTVTLGTTSGFAVLGSTTVTNTGATTIGGSAGGSIGLSPGTSYTGGGTVTQTSGVAHITDSAASTAQTDLTAAISSANSPAATSLPAADLAGQVILPGVYTTPSGAFSNSGHLTLDAQGDPTAVFIFRTTSTLTTATNSSITVTNSGQACHVFWSVGSSATLGVTSSFVGHIFSAVSITANTGAVITGSLLASTGAVTLDHNTITNDVCLATTATPTATATATSTATATPAVVPPKVIVPNGTLTVIKTVINDGGGTAVAADFMIHVKSNGDEIAGSPAVGINGTGRTYSLVPGAYVVSEDPGIAYTNSFSGIGITTGAVTVVSAKNTTITVTNNDINLGTLTVIKNVVNRYTGTSVAGDFTMHVKLNGVDIPGSPAVGVSGVGRTYRLLPGNYAVSEDEAAGYFGNFDGPALSNGYVAVVSDQNVTVSRTNYDKFVATPVTPTPTPVVTPTPTPVVTPPVTHTVTGGKLPKTGTPWNNLLALGAGLILVGAAGFTSRKVSN